MRTALVLLRPRLHALKHNWLLVARRRGNTRPAVVLLLSLGVMYGIYCSALEMFRALRWANPQTILDPLVVLYPIFTVMIVTLLFSSIFAALGSFYLAHDLDLIVAAPVGPIRLFAGKWLECTFTAAWAALVFGLPMIAGVGRFFHAGLVFALFALATIPACFLLVCAISIVVINLVALVIPAARTKELMFFVLVAVVLTVYTMIGQAGSDREIALKAVSLIQRPWVAPALWSAQVLTAALQMQIIDALFWLCPLYGATGLAAAAAIGLLHFGYLRGYSNARSGQGTARRGVSLFGAMRRLSTTLLPPHLRAVLGKEYLLFVRDLTQAGQLILLLGICLIYLVHFRAVRGGAMLPEASRLWWQGLLTLANVGMGAFVAVAVATRFAFPAVSMEGKNFWILVKSPMTLRDVLHAKFLSWFFAVGALGSIMLSVGAASIQADPQAIFFSAVTSWLLAYGIAGLAIGLGSYFANFDWEFSSQLAASMGSMIFMLACGILVALNTLPLAFLVFLRTLSALHYQISAVDWTLALVGTGVLTFSLNYLAARWALRVGEAALARKVLGE